MTRLTVSARQVSDAGSARTQCAVLPVFAGKQPTATARELDKVLGGSLKATLDLGDFSAEKGKTLFLPGSGAIKRVLLVGCGEARKFDRDAQRSFCEAIGRSLKDSKASDALVYAGELGLDGEATEWVCEYLARNVVTALYRYRQTLSKPAPAARLKRLAVNAGKALKAGRAKAALEAGAATGNGVNAARELANLPGNFCTPDYLAKEARKLARRHDKLTTRVLNEKQMQELGMGSLLSVSAGSDQPARLIVMEYRGAAKSAKPEVLVGKGITFDSGGISLKPGAKMDEMKFDMGGAASVFGTVEALCELALPINVVAIVAAAENMPSGRATKPGDVVTSMAGKTIEVLNTDAEGRLVLCDALTYAARFKPAAVIDIATLTGACVVALGAHASGLYANDDRLAEELLAAGTESHDRAWRMPLWDDYQKQLQSNFADLANIGGPAAGSVTAACFLARFAEDYRWAHLDIAGSAWDSSPKGATGRPVPMLTRYLRERAGEAVTRVGFYVVRDGEASRRLQVAARLANKAFIQGHRVFLHCADEDQARGMDELLWAFRPDSFLPHALAGNADEAVLVGWGQDPGEHDDLLINLALEPPPYFPRFQRLAEVVTQDAASLAALRAAWAFYRERGYALEKHEL